MRKILFTAEGWTYLILFVLVLAILAAENKAWLADQVGLGQTKEANAVRETFTLDDSDSILDLSTEALLVPDDPTQEAENFLQFMYEQQLQRINNGDCVTSDIDSLADTTGTQHNYSAIIDCWCGEWFKISAIGKDSTYGDFTVDSYGEFSGTI